MLCNTFFEYKLCSGVVVMDDLWRIQRGSRNGAGEMRSDRQKHFFIWLSWLWRHLCVSFPQHWEWACKKLSPCLWEKEGLLKLASLSTFVGGGERDCNSHQVLLFGFWGCVCFFVKASWSKTGKKKGTVKESCIQDKGRGRKRRQKWRILEVKWPFGEGTNKPDKWLVI